MPNIPVKRHGFATIEPYEPVVLDLERLQTGLPPWRSQNAPEGEHRYYRDDEVRKMTATERNRFYDNGMPRRRA